MPVISIYYIGCWSQLNEEGIEFHGITNLTCGIFASLRLVFWD